MVKGIKEFVRKKKLFSAVFLILISLTLIFSLIYLTQGKLAQEQKIGELKVTLEHPFLINNSWIPASELKEGDELTTIDGKKARIISIEKVHAPQGIKVYNLEDTLGLNNYVVSSSNNLEGIVAHNSQRLPLRPGISRTSWEGFRRNPIRLSRENDPVLRVDVLEEIRNYEELIEPLEKKWKLWSIGKSDLKIQPEELPEEILDHYLYRGASISSLTHNGAIDPLRLHYEGEAYFSLSPSYASGYPLGCSYREAVLLRTTFRKLFLDKSVKSIEIGHEGPAFEFVVNIKEGQTLGGGNSNLFEYFKSPEF